MLFAVAPLPVPYAGVCVTTHPEEGFCAHSLCFVFHRFDPERFSEDSAMTNFSLLGFSGSQECPELRWALESRLLCVSVVERKGGCFSLFQSKLAVVFWQIYFIARFLFSFPASFLRFAYMVATVLLSILVRKLYLHPVKGQVMDTKYELVTSPKEEAWITVSKRS